MEEQIEKRLLYVAGQVPALLAALNALIATHPAPEAFLQAFEPLESTLRESMRGLGQPAIQQGLKETCDSVLMFARACTVGN